MKRERFDYAAPGSVLTYTLTERTLAIVIAPESELDQCFVEVVGGPAIKTYPGDLNLNPSANGWVHEQITVAKVAVGVPYLCDLPEGTQINVRHSRAQNTILTGTQSLAQLVLGFVSLPCHVQALPTKRAPVDVEFTLLVTTDIDVYVPIHGRAFTAVDVHTTSVAGGADASTAIYTSRTMWDANADAYVSVESTGLFATVGDLSYLNDQEADFIRLRFALTSAGSARVVVHVRGEDA